MIRKKIYNIENPTNTIKEKILFVILWLLSVKPVLVRT